MSRYDILIQNYLETWQQQMPLNNTVFTLDQLDTNLCTSRKYLMEFLNESGGLGVQLARNVFLINDIGHGGICKKCNSDWIVFYIDGDLYKDKSSYDYDYAVWRPSLESQIILNTNKVVGNVFPLFSEHISNNKVYYINLCCDIDDKKIPVPELSMNLIPWKYVQYELPFGLVYSDKIVKR